MRCRSSRKFWGLDVRTAGYLKHFNSVAVNRADRLGAAAHPGPSGGRLLKAGRVTNALFGLSLICWIATGVHLATPVKGATRAPSSSRTIERTALTRQVEPCRVAARARRRTLGLQPRRERDSHHGRPGCTEHGAVGDGLRAAPSAPRALRSIVPGHGTRDRT
jgi:hypothetical protein